MVAGSAVVAAPDQLLCTTEDGPRRRLVRHDLAAGTRQDVPLSRSVVDVAAGAGMPVVLTSALDAPPAVEVVDLAGGPVSLVESSSELGIPGTLRRVELPDPDVAVPLAGWLCEPPEGRAAGLVAVFHGGPLKSWPEWAWRWNPWPFVAAGYTVAMLEPPMSLGYGNAAIAAGWRRWRTGIGAVAARQVRAVRELAGLASAPLALMGGSFGGYLALLTAAELRPQLVVAHGPPADLWQTATASDVSWQWIREYGDPDRERARYQDQSVPPGTVPPGTRALISHGFDDDLVPAVEALRVHRSLLRHGVRSELAVFAREGHPLLRPSNLRAWFHWVLAACAEELGGAPEHTGGMDA